MLQSYYTSCCGNDWSIQKDRSGQRKMRGNNLLFGIVMKSTVWQPIKIHQTKLWFLASCRWEHLPLRTDRPEEQDNSHFNVLRRLGWRWSDSAVPLFFLHGGVTPSSIFARRRDSAVHFCTALCRARHLPCFSVLAVRSPCFPANKPTYNPRQKNVGLGANIGYSLTNWIFNNKNHTLLSTTNCRVGAAHTTHALC